MKAPFLLFTLLTLIPLFSQATIDFNRHKEEAQLWINTHIVDEQGALKISPHDFQMIMNLVYFSYARSEATVRAQVIASKATAAAWQGWQNIALTRLDPSRELSYPEQGDKEQALFTQFIAVQKQHRKIGLTYSAVVENIIEGGALTSPNMPFAIDRLRLGARSVTVEAFLSVKQQINLLLSCIEEVSINHATSKRGWREILTSVLPGFILPSFLKIEACYKLTSTKTWAVLNNIQQISIILYHAIEEERASFYGAHYQLLYALIKKHKIASDYQTIAFNEKGLIPANSHDQKLPTLL